MRPRIPLASYFVMLLPAACCRLPAACCRPEPSPPSHSDALRGTVTYRERVDLPAGALLRVLPLDIHARDVPDWIVARSEQLVLGQVPLEVSVV